MRLYDDKKNDAIILSDIKDVAAIILHYREMFQCNRSPTTLGGSQCNQHSFQVNTFRKPIVVTTNLDHEYEAIMDSEWIKANMFLVLATEQMYVGELVVDDIEQSRRESVKFAETGDRKSKRRKTATAKGAEYAASASSASKTSSSTSSSATAGSSSAASGTSSVVSFFNKNENNGVDV